MPQPGDSLQTQWIAITQLSELIRIEICAHEEEEEEEEDPRHSDTYDTYYHSRAAVVEISGEAKYRDLLD